ncbi:MAG TPA: single-stranded DNA-binding protein [Cytophagales bacterium]|nr:single-stranded DNA-binding protein [Cytophagales bacterium]
MFCVVFNFFVDTPVVAWREIAELAQKLLRKGSHLYVEGKLKNRNHQDKGGKLPLD